jgi:hypothetical protein
VIGQRDYSIPADSGGFQNLVLSSAGTQMLGSDSTFHLLPVTVTATGSTGQKLSFVVHLARWCGIDSATLKGGERAPCVPSRQGELPENRRNDDQIG